MDRTLFFLRVESTTFRRGLNDGATWYFHRDTPRHPVKEEDVIDFLQGHVLHWRKQGYVGEDRLRSNAGFLLGWIAAQCLPLPEHVKRTVF
jgi:hypothetical protein